MLQTILPLRLKFSKIYRRSNFEEQDNTVTWIDEANRIQFTVDGHFDEKTLLTIAESVSPMEKKRLMPQYEISALPNGYNELVTLFTKLPESYRLALEMKYLLDYSGKEIADRLGISESAVNTRISRGRTLLREIAEKEGFLV